MITTTLLTLFAVGTASPQQPQWLAYEGCWQQMASEAAQSGNAVLCIQRADEGVTMSTYVNGKLQAQQRLVADGAARPVKEGTCEGAEIARWSADNQRVYIRAEVTCGGATRLMSSALVLANAQTLAEVQAVRVGDERSVRTVRYRAMAPEDYPAGLKPALDDLLARETSRVHAASALNIPDVTEAAQQLDAATLEGMLAARNAGFDLSANTLRQLAHAGVAKSTLDVMVALSYPNKFQLAQANTMVPPQTLSGGGQGVPLKPAQRGLDDERCAALSYYSSWDCSYRFGWDPYGYYDRYGYMNPWRYSPYGYNYGYGPYGYNYGYGGYGSPWAYPPNGGVIIVRPGEPGSGGTADGGGTVGRGGYTRGSTGSAGTARPRSTYGGDEPRRSVEPTYRGGSAGTSSSGGSVSGGSSSGSGSGGVSGAGHSAGSGSTSTGQTAKPRGGGE